MTVTEPQETYDEGEQSSDLNRAIGKQVKVLRERSGLTQKELGDRLGYGEDLISSLERGDGLRRGSSWRRPMNCCMPVAC